jgi:hypothetical protein
MWEGTLFSVVLLTELQVSIQTDKDSLFEAQATLYSLHLELVLMSTSTFV